MDKKLSLSGFKRSSKNTSTKRVLPYCTLVAVLLIVIYLATPKENKTPISAQLSDTRFALNTVVTITLNNCEDKDILEGAFALCNKYENIFSRTLESSELYKVNHSPETTLTVSEELASLIKKGLDYSQISNGSFDITVAPVSSLWDFTADEPKVPNETDIQNNLQYVGYQNASINGTTLIRKNPNVQFDLGAIAKGYIADQIKSYLLDSGVTSATISLGGNVLCVGEKPDNSPFNIGVQSPFKDKNDTMLAIKVKDKSIVTSGIYERCFEQNGKFYHHILDPKTGFPFDNDLLSVTIISDQSTDGDALSTMCFSLGLEQSLDYINSRNNLDAIFVTKDQQLIYSDGVKEHYEITDMR